jgi:hypothetical protein
MIRKTFLLIPMFLFWPMPLCSQPIRQSEDHFRKAILTDSSSAYFVYITIIDNRTEETRSMCIEAPFLLSALRLEMNLPLDGSSRTRVIQATLSANEHIFRFSQQNALDNLRVRYTVADFERARALISEFGVTPLMTLRSEKRQDFGDLLWNSALACALIEVGLKARVADISGQIYAEP